MEVERKENLDLTREEKALREDTEERSWTDRWGLSTQQKRQFVLGEEIERNSETLITARSIRNKRERHNQE